MMKTPALRIPFALLILAVLAAAGFVLFRAQASPGIEMHVDAITTDNTYTNDPDFDGLNPEDNTLNLTASRPSR